MLIWSSGGQPGSAWFPTHLLRCRARRCMKATRRDGGKPGIKGELVMTTLRRPVGLAVGALFVLAACGGGGGGGGDNTNLPLTLSVAAIGKTVAQIDLPTTVTVNASVQGTTTASTL